MTKKLLAAYRENRRKHPTAGARHALDWARIAIKQSTPVLDWNYDGASAEFKRHGFTVRVNVEPDYDADTSMLGTFTDKWSPDVIKRRNPDRNGYRYFDPGISYREHYKGLRDMHYGRADANRLAREYVQTDMQRAETLGTEWTMWSVSLTVSRRGITLASAGVGGVDAEPEDDYYEELVRDLLSEAIPDARAALRDLCSGGADK